MNTTQPIGRTDAAKRELAAYYASCGTPKAQKPTAKIRQEKARKRIPKVSNAQHDRLKVRAQIRAEKVREFGNGCQLRIPNVCTGKQEGLAHLEGARSRDDSPVNLLLSCNACNGWCTEHPNEARAMGFVIGAKS